MFTVKVYTSDDPAVDPLLDFVKQADRVFIIFEDEDGNIVQSLSYSPPNEPEL